MIPKISIIVPVFCAEKTLSLCIESLLNQTFTDFEIILIDDGSPDNCGKICDDYARKDVRVQSFHTENRGVSAARNLGLQVAKGKWIQFVDSDDWVDDTFLAYYLESSYIGCDICFTGYIQERGKNKSKEFFLNPGYYQGGNICDGIMYLYRRRLLGLTCNKLFRKEIIDKYDLRFNENMNSYEDELFVLMYCSHIRSLAILPGGKYHYVVYGNPSSLSSRKLPFIEIKGIAQLLYNAGKAISCRPDYSRFIKANYYWHIYDALREKYRFGGQKLSLEEEKEALFLCYDFVKDNQDSFFLFLKKKRRNFVQFLFLIKNYSWMHFVFRLYRVKCILSTSWKKIRNVIVSFYK